MSDTNLEPRAAALLLSSLFYFLLFLVSTYFARTKAFLLLPFKNYKGAYATLKDIFIVLVIFILLYAFLIPGLMTYLLRETSAITRLSVIPIASFFFTLLAIYIFARTTPSLPLKSLIKDKNFPGNQSLSHDVWVGIIALVLSLFPLFTTMGLLEALFIYMGIDLSTQQNAIQYFILMKDNILTLIPALFTIVICAPILEEFIFRGLIQSYFRKKFGTTPAIIYASILFAFFHFSVAQGIQNAAIILSLFVLSLYLGFAYEKTRALISNITLHVTFNLLNVIKIFYYTS